MAADGKIASGVNKMGRAGAPCRQTSLRHSSCGLTFLRQKKFEGDANGVFAAHQPPAADVAGEIDHRNIQRRAFTVGADMACADKDFAGVGGNGRSVIVVRANKASNAIDIGFRQAEFRAGRFEGEADVGVRPNSA